MGNIPDGVPEPRLVGSRVMSCKRLLTCLAVIGGSACAAGSTRESVAPARTGPEAATSITTRNAEAYGACVQHYNARRWEDLRACYAPDVLQDEPGTGKPWVGIDDVIDHLHLFVDSFPDNSSVPQLTLVNGSHVVSIVRLRGTNDGPFPGAPGPTHESIDLLMAHLVELEPNAKIKTEWILYDTVTMLSQLELLPVPTRTGIDEPGNVTQTVRATGDATEERNLASYRTAVEAYNAHDLDRVGDGFAERLVWTEASLPMDLDKRGALAKTSDLWRGFSNLRRTPTTVWAAGDYVVGVGEMTGTNDGAIPSLRLDRSGKKIVATYIEIVRFSANKRDRSWLFYNNVVIARQLGLL